MVIIPIAAVAFALLVLLAALCLRVLLLPRFRPALQLAGGTLLMGLLAGALGAQFGRDIPAVAAQEKADGGSATAEPLAESIPAASISESTTEAPTESAETSPAEAAPPETAPAQAAVSIAPAATPAAPQPEIKLDSSDAPPAATKPEDIKIETLADGTIVIPAGRPEWVKVAKSDFTDPNVHRVYVTSHPHALPEDAQSGLDESLKRATDQYIADKLHSPLAAKFIPYDIQAIRDRFVKQSYRETVTFPPPLGVMQQLHAQLEFDQGFRDEIRQTWAGRIADSRLYQVGLGAGAALLLLGSVFSYFRLDNATRGYYTGRLQFLTAAAILAIVALGTAAAFQFTWL